MESYSGWTDVLVDGAITPNFILDARLSLMSGSNTAF